ncbi:hypothetical protein JG688_00015780 [Phytophthora aleatoria]|uniref:Uncharacterized protein n=1 Tax=Phytophthora aleatoria TaxID=2496075 RepID=A0A8J5ISP8_9STRA|nr:hypothetical protein JG688_00015780 [Phytophthora aleatoria]
MARDDEYEMVPRVERIEQQIPAKWSEFTGKPMQMTYYVTKVNTFRENPDLLPPSDSFTTWATLQLRREIADEGRYLSDADLKSIIRQEWRTDLTRNILATRLNRHGSKDGPVWTMVATSFHDASSNAASVVMVRGSAHTDDEKEYGESFGTLPLGTRDKGDCTTEFLASAEQVKETEFEIAINQINNTMQDYWPPNSMCVHF